MLLCLFLSVLFHSLHLSFLKLCLPHSCRPYLSSQLLPILLFYPSFTSMSLPLALLHHTCPLKGTYESQTTTYNPVEIWSASINWICVTKITHSMWFLQNCIGQTFFPKLKLKGQCSSCHESVLSQCSRRLKASLARVLLVKRACFFFVSFSVCLSFCHVYLLFGRCFGCCVYPFSIQPNMHYLLMYKLVVNFVLGQVSIMIALKGPVVKLYKILYSYKETLGLHLLLFID